MIKQCEKIKSEVYFTIDSISVDNDSGEIDIICYINNYFLNEGSLGLFQFSINGGGSYANATLAAVQTEPDFDEILLNHKQRKLHIIWNALTDIGAAAAQSDLKLKISFYDETAQSGTESKQKEYEITETVDFSPETEINFIKPYSHENKFDFNFKNVICITTKQVHYKIEVSEYKTFPIGETYIYDTGDSQTGWQVDGSPFPAGGCNTDTSAPKTITFTTAALNNLSEDIYYCRITRIVQ